MPYDWPEETDFAYWELDVTDRACPACGRMMHVCDHRYRRFHTLQGPVELLCRLDHCPDPHCPGHKKTKSPETEVTLALPKWAIAWDVFCWIGHRRCSRHMAIPLIQTELLDDYAIKLSEDAIDQYIRRYQVMLAARQQDPESLRRQYDPVADLILCIDGVQPEKGNETLYVVRELTQKRIWFAEPLLSATAAEVRRLIVKAREWAEALDKPVALWLSDRQDAFVTGIAAEFPEVPHRYCDNHFLRDVAQPVLEADSHAKVQMRKKVRGLRTIEQAVLAQAQGSAEGRPHARACGSHCHGARGGGPACGRDRCRGLCGPRLLHGGARDPQRRSRRAVASSRLADGGGAERGPRVAPTELGGEKRGFAEEQLGRLTACIQGGLDEVKEQQEVIREYVAVIAEVAATLEPGTADVTERQEQFEALIDQFEATEDPIRHGMATVMLSFLAGLFVGEEDYEGIRDNLELERWFRLPKSHERRIHGRRHAGVRLVQTGATLVPALDAHAAHPGPFTADDLMPYRGAREPPCQTQALDRRKVMRKARSKKQRPALLADLERRYRELPSS